MTGTVLVADDSPTIQNKAKGILTGEGLEVVTVSNGVAAIKKLPQVKPLLILADVAMPGRDGYEVCDFVKKSADLRHIPVVLIFSDADPYSEEQGARVHADGKIRKLAAGKPFVPEELISTVTGLLAQAESRASSRPVTEPVDEESALYPKKPLDFGSFPKGVPFADPVTEEASPPTWSGPAPTPSAPAPEATFPSELSEEPPAPDAAPPVLLSSGPAEEAPASHDEPLLVEEPPPVEPPPTPRTQRTMLFRTPADIAEPLLHDELATPPPEPEPPPLLEETQPAAPIRPPRSFFPPDRTTPEARPVFSEPEAAAESPSESTETAPEAVISSGPDTPVDTNLVHSIVQKVVAKMSPPALPQEAVDEMTRKLAGEIIAEIITESS